MHHIHTMLFQKFKITKNEQNYTTEKDYKCLNTAENLQRQTEFSAYLSGRAIIASQLK